MEDTPLGPVNRMRRRHKVKPTPKQIMALKYINQGMSKRKAMLKAGYAPNTANIPSLNLMNRPGVKMALGMMKNELQEAGLTTKYMANKMKEWMEATKVHGSLTEPDRMVPDYDVQIKAYDRWEKSIQDSETIPKGMVGKRTLSVTEYILGTMGKEDNET